jgi:hypothetical protein
VSGARVCQLLYARIHAASSADAAAACMTSSLSHPHIHTHTLTFGTLTRLYRHLDMPTQAHMSQNSTQLCMYQQTVQLTRLALPYALISLRPWPALLRFPSHSRSPHNRKPVATKAVSTEKSPPYRPSLRRQCPTHRSIQRRWFPCGARRQIASHRGRFGGLFLLQGQSTGATSLRGRMGLFIQPDSV